MSEEYIAWLRKQILRAEGVISTAQAARFDATVERAWAAAFQEALNMALMIREVSIP